MKSVPAFSLKWARNLIILVVSFPVIFWGCGPAVSETLHSREGRFTVTLPPGYPSPEKSTHTVPSPNGDIQLTMLLSERNEGAFMIGFFDYPGNIMESEIEARLDGGRDGALGNINGTLEKEEPYKVKGYPGRKIYFSGAQGGRNIYGQAIFCVVKNRFYQVVAFSVSKDALAKPEIQSFFSSFKLADEP